MGVWRQRSADQGAGSPPLFYSCDLFVEPFSAEPVDEEKQAGGGPGDGVAGENGDDGVPVGDGCEEPEES